MQTKTFLKILFAVLALVVIVVLIVFTSGKNKRLDRLDDFSLDSAIEVRDAMISEVEVAVLESFPVQVHVTAFGTFPDGCSDLHEVVRERIESTFHVTVTTERPREAICTTAVTPFEETFPLDVENLFAGEYKVVVNGIEKGFTLAQDNLVEFDAGKK